MSQFTLESVHVASPCHADWEMMDGSDQVKLCGSCRKNVYNLSTLTRREAEALIAEQEGNLCVRFYRRADGTIMTQDCPVGLEKARRIAMAPLKWLAAGIALVAAAWCCVVSQEGTSPEDEELRGEGFRTLVSSVPPLKTISDWVSPSPTPAYDRQEVMGGMSFSPTGAVSDIPDLPPLPSDENPNGTVEFSDMHKFE